MDIGITSYSVAAGFFAVLAAMLLTGWRGRLHGALLVIATGVSACWAASAAYVAWPGHGAAGSEIYRALEVIRSIIWFAFLFQLLAPLKRSQAGQQGVLRYAAPLVLAFSAAVLLIDVLPGVLTSEVTAPTALDVRILTHLAMALIGLALVEQLFRNTRPERRWAVKYLFLGIGALFAYDFFMYAHALLFRHMDPDLWEARGFVNAVIVPMLGVSAARNPDWSVDVFVSRKMVFHAASLLGAGAYLLGMAGVGYYIRLYGGTWGTAIQAAFLFLAVVLLFVLLFSGQIRARAKVFLSKHFFNYKYDYRDEWLKLSRTLTSDENLGDVRERVIRALADIVDSPGGQLWSRTESGRFTHAAHWNMDEQIAATVKPDSGLIQFMTERQWIIDLHELEEEPEGYSGLVLPQWLETMRRAWLVVPLMQGGELLAFIILADPRAPRPINWEDRDLLKTVGLQLASYVALLDTSRALMDARQFEAFNRLSSYVVHDLKNISAQLGLVVSNAARHLNNPAFVEDAMKTVENATTRMNRMLAQLRKGKTEEQGKSIVSVHEVLNQAVGLCANRKPVPVLKPVSEDLLLLIERDRLIDVLAHVMQNGQEAADPSGFVEVAACRSGTDVVIEVTDNGCGMDGQFIRERLFKPFDTTKGNAGMGIGVFESREFVWAQGGDMVVSSKQGEGTTFRFSLPLYQDVPRERSEVHALGSVQ